MRIDETYAYLCVHDTAAAIDFYGKAFGATEKFRLVEPSGRIGHAELAFGPHTVMLCDEFPECGIRSATSLGATPVTIHLHVDDADAMLARATPMRRESDFPRPLPAYREAPRPTPKSDRRWGLPELLAAAERRPTPSPRLSALVATPGSRVAVMLVGTVLVSAVGFGLLALVGSVL